VRFFRISFAAISLSFGVTGCAGLLGLDDFTEGESSAGTQSSGSTQSGSTEAGPGPGSGGSGTGEPAASTSSTQSGPGGPGGGGGAPPGELVVTPDEPKVGILRPLQLGANQDVTWSIEESGDEAGAVDDSGLYFAPEAPGTFHVVATSVEDESLTATVEITVVGLGVTVLGGLVGGPGNIDGQARRAHFDSPWGVAEDSNDTRLIYVSDQNNHTIRKYDDDTGVVTTLAGKAGESGAVDGPGVDARFDYPGDIVADGNVWVVDSDNHCIRQINPTTGATSTLAGECGVRGSVDGSDGDSSLFDGIVSMVLGPSGTALYVCQQGGSGSSIRRISRSSGATSTIISNLNTPTCDLADDTAYGVIYYTARVGSDNELRSFPDPYNPSQDVYLADFPDGARGLAAVTAAGNANHIYTAVRDYDTDEQHILRVDRSLETVFQEYLGGGTGYVDGPVADVRLNDVSNLSGFRNTGSIYFTDRDGTARRLNVYDEEVETILGPIPNNFPVDGGKTVARIPNPIGLALDGEGSIFETNFGENDNRIRKIDLATGAIESFSGVGGDFENDDDIVDGAADEATFGIAVGAVYIDGDLYITDFFGSAVRRVDGVTGAVQTIAGQLNEPGNADGVGAAARFSFAGTDGIGGGIATDGVDLYVCDTSNYKIKKVDLSSGTVTTIAGGTEGSIDGIGDQAQFSSPAGITYADGHLYVAEFITHIVRKIDLSNNEVTTIAGRAGELGHADGGLGTSTLAAPIGLAADGHGNLYVSEFNGSAIRRIRLDDNRTTTFVGTFGARGFNAAPLPTTLNCPAGMLVDPNGDLVFSDACDGVVAILKSL